MKLIIINGLRTLCVLATAWIGYGVLQGGILQHQRPLESYPKSISQIADIGIGMVHPTEEDIEQEAVFFLQMDTPQIALFFFKATQNYTHLLEALQIGDTITVYYAPVNKGIDRFEGELIQIEKEGVCLLAFRGYQEKGMSGILWGVGWLVTTLVVLWLIWRPERHKTPEDLPHN